MKIAYNNRNTMPGDRRVDSFADPRLVPGTVFMDHDELYYVISRPGHCQDPGLGGEFLFTAVVVLPLLLVAGPGMETIEGTVLETQADVVALDWEVDVVDATGSLFRWLEDDPRTGDQFAWLQPGETHPVSAAAVRFPVTAWG